MEQWLIAIVAAIVGAAASWVVSAALQRRTLISYSVEPTELVPAGRNQLTISYDGHPVEEPHLVIVRFENAGPRDVTPEDFSGGHLGVQVRGCTVLAALDPGPRRLTISRPEGEPPIVTSDPFLFTKGAVLEMRLLLNGMPPADGVVPHVALRNTRVGEKWTLAERLLDALRMSVVPFGVR